MIMTRDQTMGEMTFVIKPPITLKGRIDNRPGPLASITSVSKRVWHIRTLARIPERRIELQFVLCSLSMRLRRQRAKPSGSIFRMLRTELTRSILGFSVDLLQRFLLGVFSPLLIAVSNVNLSPVGCTRPSNAHISCSSRCIKPRGSPTRTKLLVPAKQPASLKPLVSDSP